MLFYAYAENQNQFLEKDVPISHHYLFTFYSLSDSSYVSKLILSLCSFKCLVREELPLYLYQVLIIHGEIQIIRTVWTLSSKNIQPACRTRHVYTKLKDSPKAIINKCKNRMLSILNNIFMLPLQFCSTILLFHSEFIEILNEHGYK